MHDPRLVLLDEPLAGLSETGRPVIWQYIRRMQSEGRTLEGLGITPTAMEVIVPSYLWRFRKTGQFKSGRFA